MNKWRLINSGFLTGAMNMALDEALLHSVAQGKSLPVLRLYRWLPATMTLGYAQSVNKDIDLEVCRRAGMDVVRRSTGGRAVLHDEEVTYAVIAPLREQVFGHTVLDSYRVISEVLLKTLRKLGLPAQLVPGKPRGGQQNPTRAVCFAAPSQYELIIDGCKVAGSAQKRYAQTFLQHGSIPVEMDLELLGRALRSETNNAVAESLSTVGWLNRYSPDPIKVADVETLLAQTFAEHLQVEWDCSEPTDEELALARQMCEEKFGHDDWNMKH